MMRIRYAKHRKNQLFRSLLAGFLLGLVGALIAGWFIAPVKHTYTPSVTRVTEAGRIETFRIQPAEDLLVSASTHPEGLADDLAVALPANRAEVPTDVRLYKVRNTEDKVIGLASRTTTPDADDWMLYFAARGAMYLSVEATTPTTIGRILGGSESLEDQVGTFELRRTGDGEDRRIEIETAIQRAAS